MLIYLDTAIVSYAIEGAPEFQARAMHRLGVAAAAADDIATSDLTRLECLVYPFRNRDLALEANDRQFLGNTALLPLPALAYDRAAQIRADRNFSVLDSLHLAAAIIGNCDLILTNDARLAGFPDIAVEMLPAVP